VSFRESKQESLSLVSRFYTSGDLFQRMSELAVQSAKGANSASDRQELDQEFQQHIAEIGRIATQTSTLSTVSSLDISTVSGANNALGTLLDAALTSVRSERSRLGAAQNTLQYTESFLDTFSLSLSSAQSHIQDSDFASETANLTKNQILLQSSNSMLVQANQSSSSVLSL
jgi:flagellin